VSKKVNLQLVPVYGYWVVYENQEDDMMWEEPVIAMGNTDEGQEDEYPVFYSIGGDGIVSSVENESTRELNITLLYQGNDASWKRTTSYSASSYKTGEPLEVIAHRAYWYHNYLGEVGKRRKKDEETMFEEWKERGER
tara:strand:- start:323 stop:736 length:414 start_codon:yes stop_codon:yes gene_type:complete